MQALAEAVAQVVVMFKLFLGHLQASHDPCFTYMLHVGLQFYTHVYGRPMTLLGLADRVFYAYNCRRPTAPVLASHIELQEVVSSLCDRADLLPGMRHNLNIIVEALRPGIDYLRVPTTHTQLMPDLLPARAKSPFVPPPCAITQLFDIEKTRLLGEMGIYKASQLDPSVLGRLEFALSKTPLYVGEIVPVDAKFEKLRNVACSETFRSCEEMWFRLGEMPWPTDARY